MDIRKLQRAIVDGLEDVKAQDILVFNTEHLSSLFERVIIASGTSNRQTKALAAGVRDAVREAGFPVLATEGSENGEWIIVDCGAAVAHIFQPAIREYYRLEEIWGGKPVKMKLGANGPKGLVKASEDAGDEADEDEDAVAPVRQPAAKKVAKEVAPRAARAAKPASPVLPARASTAGTVAGKKAVAKKAQTTAARKSAATPAATAAAAKTARPAAARKTAARKTPLLTAPATQTVVVKPSLRASASGKAAAAKSAAGARRAAPGAADAPAARKPAAARKTAPKRG